MGEHPYGTHGKCLRWMPPQPVLVLHLERRKILNVGDLKNAPAWARPIVAAAMMLNVG